MFVWKKFGILAVSGLMFAIGSFMVAPVANAVTLALEVYNDNGEATDFTAELEITATTDGLLFTFTNTSALDGNALESAIDQIYFEAGYANIFETATLAPPGGTTGTVVFSQGTVTPGTKPQDSGTIDWTTTWAEGYFTRDGAKNNGINALGYDGADDSLTLYLAFIDGESVSAHLMSKLILNNSSFTMVAIHANACVDRPDTSCNAYATPIPAAIWLLGSALLGLVGFGARRKATA